MGQLGRRAIGRSGLGGLSVPCGVECAPFNFGAFPRVVPQELINEGEHPLSDNLADLVRTRYKNRTFEQTVCRQFMRFPVRRHIPICFLWRLLSPRSQPFVALRCARHRLLAPTKSWSRRLPWATRGTAASWSRPLRNF
eukprot:scaffold21221_cov60-Phaeocystis_antarctica.AAC.7